jgi:hypothetical protein
MIVAAMLAAGPLAAQTSLVCPVPAGSGGRACEAFHYHVQMYRPDTKQRVEIFATPQFATQASCERARDARAAANAKAVEFIRAKQPQYEADRFGPCHCDMTNDKGSATFLTDAQRVLQIRIAEDIRLRVRERLLDMGLTTDSEIVRGLDLDPPSTPILGAPKLVPPPATSAAAIATSPDDLKPTRTLDSTKPSIAALDLPLVDIGPGGAAATPAVQPVSPTAVPPVQASAAGAATAPAGALPPVVPANAPAGEPPVEEQKVVAEPAPAPSPNAPTEEEMLSAQDTAERFVSYETQRIQNVLKASAAIGDEEVKSKIFEACMQRIQLLSNLRLLIEGSGMRGRLATAAREAESETDRLGLMTKLFGDEVKKHWAPQDARDVVFNVESDVEAAPERVLRDSGGKYTQQQKRHALYLVLARTQPSEDQRLWLSAVVEEFLR